MASFNQSRSVRAVTIIFSVLVFVQACSSVPRTQVPKTMVEQAGIDGIPLARQWGDVPSENYYQFLDLDDEQLKQQNKGIYGREHHYLALSGGSSRGAFGAGLLAGWAQRGDRPVFTMVSGVSTGALIAPYAFLGPKYDHIIKEVYTEHSTDDMFRRKNIFKILGGDSVSDVSGFVDMIEYYLPDNLIDEIGQQYLLGRELVIGTTNLDVARPMITEKLKVKGKPKLYVIRNAQLKSEWGKVDRKAISIGVRSLNSLMRTQGLGDLYRIYVGARRDDIDYNLAYIPDSFVDKSKELVDKETMVELYSVGQKLGREGYDWYKVPPGAKVENEPEAPLAAAQATDAEDEEMPRAALGGI